MEALTPAETLIKSGVDNRVDCTVGEGYVVGEELETMEPFWQLLKQV